MAQHPNSLQELLAKLSGQGAATTPQAAADRLMGGFTPQVAPAGRTPEETARLEQTILNTAPTPTSRAGELVGAAGDLASTIGGNITEGAKTFGQNFIGAPVAAADFLFSPDRPSLGEAASSAGVGLPDFQIGALGTDAVAPQVVAPPTLLAAEPTVAPSAPTEDLLPPAEGVTPPSALAPPVAPPVAPTAPSGGLTTQGGIPLSEFLAGGAIPEAGLLRAEVPLGGRGDSGAAGEAAMQAAGVAAGTRAGPDGTFAAPRTGTARGPDSRDSPTGEVSQSDRADIAKGQVAGASAGDKARAAEVAARNGLDPRTGLPLDEAVVEEAPTPEEVAIAEAKAEGVRLENERKQQIIDQGNQPNATGFQKKQGEWEERKKDLEAEGMSEKEIAARRRAFLHGDTFDPFEFENIGGDTGSTEGSTPAASTERQAFDTMEEAQAANLPAGTKITIGGRNATT